MIPATREEQKIILAILKENGVKEARNIQRDPENEIFVCEAAVDEFVGAEN